PDFDLAHLGKGNVYINLKEFNKANHHLSRAIELGDQEAMAYHYRGYARAHSGDPKGAMEDYDKAIAMDNYSVKTYVYRADLKARTGELKDGIPDCNRALELQPNNPLALATRGRIYFFLSQFENAV